MQVIKLALCDRISFIDNCYLKYSICYHLIEVIDPSHSCLRIASDACQKLWVLDADNIGKIITIIQNHVKGSIFEMQYVLNELYVLICFTLPSIQWNDSRGNGRCCMIHIREEVIIGPLYLGTHGHRVVMSIAVTTGTRTQPALDQSSSGMEVKHTKPAFHT